MGCESTDFKRKSDEKVKISKEKRRESRDFNRRVMGKSRFQWKREEEVAISKERCKERRMFNRKVLRK